MNWPIVAMARTGADSDLRHSRGVGRIASGANAADNLKMLMKIKFALALGTLLVTALLASAAPLGTEFTYQGRLSDNGAPASGTYDLRFTIYDSVNGVNAVAGPLISSSVPLRSSGDPAPSGREGRESRSQQ